MKLTAPDVPPEARTLVGQANARRVFGIAAGGR
jgi:hypothetical protein